MRNNNRVFSVEGAELSVCSGAVMGVLTATFLLATPVLRAKLVWERQTIELYADPLKEDLACNFACTNDGTIPTDISQLEGSCGCVIGFSSQRHFEPGQSGEITARFVIGDRRGLQKVNIAVVTNDRPDPTILTLIVRIPELVLIQPAAVSWQHGEKAAPKRFTVEILQDVPIRRCRRRKF